MNGTRTIGAVMTIGLSVAFAMFSPSVMAVPIVGATAGGTVGGVPLTSDSDSGTTAASAAVVDPGGEYAGRGAADSSGRLAASADFFGASGTFATITGGATWTDTFDASAGDSATFEFFIPGAGIGFEANNVGGLSGSFLVEILFNGASVFSASAEVETLIGSPAAESDLSLAQGGTILDAAFAADVAPGFGLGGAGYRFDAFSGFLDLTAIDGTNTIVYSMSTSVDGLIGETSALASIGDPLNLSTQPAGVTLTTGPPVVPVPEPATLLLVGAGLTGLAGMRRGFRKIDAE